MNYLAFLPRIPSYNNPLTLSYNINETARVDSDNLTSNTLILFEQQGVTRIFRNKTIESKKESLYVTGIKNLRKKINFLQLNNDYQNGDISEDEYENEINENPDKYIVQISILKDSFDFAVLNEIVSKIDNDLSVDEVAEIFSIDVATRQKFIQ